MGHFFARDHPDGPGALFGGGSGAVSAWIGGPAASSCDLGAVKQQTLCLCMIVKNESRVIERCLSAVRPLIDYWVISDTGSTDGTQDADPQGAGRRSRRTPRGTLGRLRAQPDPEHPARPRQGRLPAHPRRRPRLRQDAPLPRLTADSYMLRYDVPGPSTGSSTSCGATGSGATRASPTSTRAPTSPMCRRTWTRSSSRTTPTAGAAATSSSATRGCCGASSNATPTTRAPSSTSPTPNATWARPRRRSPSTSGARRWAAGARRSTAPCWKPESCGRSRPTTGRRRWTRSPAPGTPRPSGWKPATSWLAAAR